MAPPKRDPWKELEAPDGGVADAWDAMASADVEPAQAPAAAPESDQGTLLDWLKSRTRAGAALRGGGQGLTMGFSDELRGLHGASEELSGQLGEAMGTPGKVLADYPGRPLADALLRRYKADRDAARMEQRQAEETQPAAYRASEFAGGMLSPSPGSKAKGLARVAQMAKQGALTGAVAGAGLSEAGIGAASGEESRGLGGLAADTAAGGGLGGLIGGTVGPAVARGGEKFADWLRRRSEESAMRASGLTAGINNKLRKLGITPEDARELGKAALDMGLVRAGGTPEDVANAAAEAMPRYGAAIEGTLAEATRRGGQADEMAAALKALARIEAEGIAMPGAAPALTTVQQRAAGKAIGLVEDIAGQGEVTPGSLEALNKLKSKAYGAVNWGDEAPEAERLYRAGTRGLREAIEEQVGAVEPQLADELRHANMRYGQLAELQPLAEAEAQRGMARQTFGPLGMMAGGALGGIVGDVMGDRSTAALLGTVLGPALARSLRMRGPSTMAVGLRGAQGAAPGAARGAVQASEYEAVKAFLEGNGGR
jgi:hypothetical protein